MSYNYSGDYSEVLTGYEEGVNTKYKFRQNVSSSSSMKINIPHPHHRYDNNFRYHKPGCLIEIPFLLWDVCFLTLQRCDGSEEEEYAKIQTQFLWVSKGNISAIE